MQQIADPAIQNLPAAQCQRLADGGRDLPCLGQDFRQVRCDVAVLQHLLAAHDKAVLIGSGGFQISGGRFRKVRVRNRDRRNAASSARFTLPADQLCQAEKRRGFVGENQVKGCFQRNQFHAGP